MLFESRFGKKYPDWSALPLSADSLKPLRQYQRRDTAPVFVLQNGRPDDARAIAWFFSASFDHKLVVVNLPALLNTCFRNTDRKINHLFSRPGNQNAVLFFDEADALLASRSIAAQKAAYLIARIAAHQAPVFLASRTALAAEWNIPGFESQIIRLNGGLDASELCQVC